jgi:hypothetical protein
LIENFLLDELIAVAYLSDIQLADNFSSKKTSHGFSDYCFPFFFRQNLLFSKERLAYLEKMLFKTFFDLK